MLAVASASAILAGLGANVLSGPAGLLPSWIGPEVWIGLVAAGLIGLAMLAFLHWRMRRRFGALGPIGQALRSMNDGQTDAGSLAVAVGLGPEAEAWNAMLDNSDRMRRRLVIEQAKKTLGDRRSSAGDLPAACDAIPQGLVLLDERGRIRYANGAAAAFFPGDRKKIIGSDIAEFVSDRSVIDAVGSILSGPNARGGTFEVEAADAGGVLRISVRPVRRSGPSAAVIVIEDVTQQRMAAEARNDFLAKATHELRTPLTNILLYVETAMEDGADNPALRAQALNVINQEARRLEGMVGDVLSVSEIEAGALSLKTDDVRLEALFDQIETDFETQAAEKEINLLFNLPPKLEVIQGDRDKIVAILTNLVGNALKYTPAGGKVEVNVNQEPDRLIVEVVDTGIGVSREDAEHIFERFYRAKDTRVEDITGSGLGLSLAREMARLHGGDITLQSEPDAGSTFTLTLPCLAEAVAV